jgi:hypothetical protein
VDDWERSGVETTAPQRLYPVGRMPPLIGPAFSSPYSPARRRQLGAGDLGSPCGGVLLARDGDALIRFTPPG